MDEKTICNLVRKHLREGFPLFDEGHEVNVHFGDGDVYLGYRTRPSNIPKKNTTHFDVQITDNICFLLWIELVENERGKGKGKALYQSIENFAREYGCSVSRMTPSGHSKTRTRKEYMIEELGYEEFGDLEVVKSL